MKNMTRREAVGTMAMGLLLKGSLATAANHHGRIIVSGASGQLGGLTVKALLARGVAARDLILVSRTPEDLAEYARLGAATRAGDYTKPDTLPAAYAGGTRMLLISMGFGSMPRPQAHGNAITAAKAAGVKQIAYTSWIGITKGDKEGLAVDHLATEDLLRKSGVAWTFLRNSLYMETQLAAAARMIADGKAVIPHPEYPVGYVSRENCAEAAAAVLAPGHDRKSYDITGPALLGVRDIAAAASQATGKPINVVPADPAAAPVHGITNAATEVVSTAVADLTGHPATTIAEFFTAHRAQLLKQA